MKDDIRSIVKEGYEKGDYVGHFRTDPRPDKIGKKFLDRLSSLLPNAAKILDLGCGIGIPYDRYLTDKGFQVTGVDVTHKHVEQARKNVPGAVFIEGDFSRTDFGSGRFHGIIALYSIFHLPREEHSELFRRMCTLLEDGGIVLMTLGTGSGEGVEENWAGARMAWSNYDPDTYRSIIALSGFEIVESEFEGQPGEEEYHWWVIARKMS